MRLPDPRERPWLTVAEVAQITGEGTKAIRQAIASEQLPVLRIGRYVRIPTAGFYELVGLIPLQQRGRARHRLGHRSDAHPG